jgi:hypothetical protein
VATQIAGADRSVTGGVTRKRLDVLWVMASDLGGRPNPLGRLDVPASLVAHSTSSRDIAEGTENCRKFVRAATSEVNQRKIS